MLYDGTWLEASTEMDIYFIFLFELGILDIQSKLQLFNVMVLNLFRMSNLRVSHFDL
jgi:hypothetical protein